MAGSDVTVYYDASCPLCRREIALYEGRADAAFIDVSDPANVPEDLSPEDAMARFHVRERGQLKSGAAAFAALWRVTRGFQLVGRIASLPVIRPMMEGLYRAFLLIRPFIQRGARAAERRASCR